MSESVLELSNVPSLTEAKRDLPHLSPSIAKILLARSPLHAWDAHRLGGNHQREQTEAMSRGRVLETLLFGVGPTIVAVEHYDWRTKAAQEIRDEAESRGYLPVLAHKLREYEDTVGAWRSQLAARTIHFVGDSQVTLTWSEEGTPCKGILDHLILEGDQATILDFKTCENASDEACARAFTNFGYDVQYAAYTEAVERSYPRLAGRVRFFFLFCETTRPHAINVVEPAGSMRQLGSAKWRRAVSVWGRCLRDGEFPGYSAQPCRIEAKPWQLDEILSEPEGERGDANF